MDGMVRVGTVSDVNKSNRTVRVHFPDVDIISGWLKVIYRPPYIPKSETAVGGEGEEAFAEHYHDITVIEWMPDVGATVLCLFNESFNGDGYVLGALV